MNTSEIKRLPFWNKVEWRKEKTEPPVKYTKTVRGSPNHRAPSPDHCLRSVPKNLLELRRELMYELREAYKVKFIAPYGEKVNFPYLPPIPADGAVRFVERLRPFGVRFVHDFESLPVCRCDVSDELFECFQAHQNPVVWPNDYAADYFADRNFQRFLSGRSDNVALLHFSRMFMIVGLSCRIWFYIFQDSDKLHTKTFSSLEEFSEGLVEFIDREFTKAWRDSFLMCPSPYPRGNVFPLVSDNPREPRSKDISSERVKFVNEATESSRSPAKTEILDFADDGRVSLGLMLNESQSDNDSGLVKDKSMLSDYEDLNVMETAHETTISVHKSIQDENNLMMFSDSCSSLDGNEEYPDFYLTDDERVS